MIRILPNLNQQKSKANTRTQMASKNVSSPQFHKNPSFGIAHYLQPQSIALMPDIIHLAQRTLEKNRHLCADLFNGQSKCCGQSLFLERNRDNIVLARGNRLLRAGINIEDFENNSLVVQDPLKGIRYRFNDFNLNEGSFSYIKRESRTERLNSSIDTKDFFGLDELTHKALKFFLSGVI